MLGNENDPAEEKTLRNFIEISNQRSAQELEFDLSPRSRKLHRGIFSKKRERNSASRRQRCRSIEMALPSDNENISRQSTVQK